MKFIRLGTVYPHYWSRFCLAHPEIHSLSYSEQKQLLDRDSYGWSDFWSNALRSFGYEGFEIEVNAEAVQKKWAQENGISWTNAGWILEIATAQVKRFRPDVLFLNEYTILNAEWIRTIRRECPSIRLVMGWCGAPYERNSALSSYDLVLSCVPELIEKLRSSGLRTEFLQHAFEPRILDRLPSEASKDIAFSFVGQIVRAESYHRSREEVLRELVKLCEIEIFCPSVFQNYSIEVKQMAKKALGLVLAQCERLLPFQLKAELSDRIKRLSRSSWRTASPDLLKSMRPPVFGLEMFRTLQRSKISWNSHIDISPNSASNMRLFEVTGVGSCLLTDSRSNLSDMFSVDREVVVYDSAEDCAEKVRWLLNHETERLEIAKAGQKRCLKDHTFAQRAGAFDDYIKKALARL